MLDPAQRNLAALRILTTLEGEEREPTRAEQTILARYSGWGALPQVFDRWPGDWRDVAGELRTLVSDEEWLGRAVQSCRCHVRGLDPERVQVDERRCHASVIPVAVEVVSGW